MPSQPLNSHPPETPTNQTVCVVRNPSEATHHAHEDHLNAEPTSDTCAWVAQAMNSETFLCKIGDFLKDYGPVHVPEEDVLKCKKYLVEANLLEYSQGKYIFPQYAIPSPDRQGDEVKVFEVAPIIEAIFDYADSVSKRGNAFTAKPGPANKMGACIIEDEDYVGVLPNNNIIIGKVFQKNRTWDDQITVREQIVGDCYYILNDDPRRMFIFGTTMEDRRMSVWYFSRSHSVKSISFDWVSDDVDRFIEIYLAFAFATPAELGVDPLVHKAPVNPKSRDPGERVQQYIYECRPQVDETNSAASETRYYKTQKSLGPGRPDRISRRMTRIWQVVEVDSIDPAKEITGAKPVILKDVWLDVARKTEAENMDLIFEAVDKFVADAHERYPGPRGLSQFVAEEPRFEHFDQQTRTRLEHLFTGKQYRSLFLTKRHAWKGEKTKKLSENVKRPLDPIFLSRTTAKKDAGCVGELPRTAFSRESTSLQPKPSVEESLTETQAQTALADRAFAQRQQCRFVYEEVCSTLWDLPTLGDLTDVLRQALDALQVLWCAGWVHRDVSSGNILAFPAFECNQMKWKVKLSDLEVSQPHCHRTQSSDPRIGTPYFMPHEILDQEYLLQRLRDDESPGDNFADQLKFPDGEANPNYQRFLNFHRFYGKTFTTLPANATVHIPPRNAVVSYNYQHELESLWWIALYYITVGVGHTPSFQYAATIFVEELRLVGARSNALTVNNAHQLENVLHPNLKVAFPQAMNILREQLYVQYIIRAIFGQLDIPESYSQIHGKFATVFDNILSGNAGGWKQTKIVPRKPKDKPYKRALEDMPSLEDNPKSDKRGRIGE